MSTIIAIINKYSRGEVLRRRAFSTIAVVVENFASLFRCFSPLTINSRQKNKIERTDRRDNATYNLTASTCIAITLVEYCKVFSLIIAL